MKIKEGNTLPKSWATSPLSELLIALESGSRPRGGVKHIITGIPSVGAEHLDNNGEFKFKKVKFVPKEFVAKMTRGHIQKGDILIVKDGATTGKTSLVRDSFPYPEAVINEHVFKCRCTDDVDSKYVFYFLFSADGNQQILKDFRGAAQGGISQRFVEIVTVPIAHFNEQKRIVAEIEKQFSRLDEATAALKRIKANLKRYKASVLKAAVEGKLTEEWRKEYLPAPSSRPGKFYTYAILCDDDSIYIGHTDNITRRWKEHRDGQGAEWTKEHKPIKIAHYEEYEKRQEAADREKWLKTGFGRKWIKRELAAGRTRQAGDIELASELLKRILAERRRKWEESEQERMKAKGKEQKDDKWREKYKEPEDPREEDIYKRPTKWTWATLGHLLKDIQAGKSFKCNERPPKDGETGIVKVSSVTWGEFNELESKTITDDSKINPEYSIKPGDFLFSRANTIELVGACVIVKGYSRDLLLSDKILRFDFVYELKQWILICLKSRFGRDEIESLATGNQESMRNISQNNILKIRIPLPPEKKQKVLINEMQQRISILDQFDQSCDVNLKRTERLRQSILKKAFSGKLVPQEAEDKSASDFKW